MVAAVGVLAGVLLLAGGSARAHVSIAEPEHVAGSYTLLTFGVPHGCDGSPTTEVRIQMPESIPAVTPTVNPSWDVEVVMEELAEPITGSHGEEITERAAEVVYTATTPLPDGLRDAFVLSVRIPDDAAGETLYFPTIQSCEEGETAWIEIPEDGQDAGELEEPAPSISVVADGEQGDDHSDDAAASDAATAAGDDETDSESDEDDAGVATGLAIGALVVGVGGAGLGGTALVRQRRR